MTRLLCLFLVALACTAGCARAAQPNSNCEWPTENTGSLDLSQSRQARHLTADAERAEDLAVRYADVRRAPHSGHVESWAEYGRTRDQCMAVLFKIIGNSHGVSEEQIRLALTHRRADLDLAVVLSFIVLYVWATSVIVRRISRHYRGHQESSDWLIMTVYTSVIASAVGVFLGEQWSGIMEDVRVGNGHLSYRAERIPWVHHRLEIFIGGVVLFLFLAALARRKMSASRAIPETPQPSGSLHLNF